MRRGWSNEFLNEQNPTCLDDCPKKLWVFRLLVLAQFALVAAICFVTRPLYPQWHTWLVLLVGIALGLWAIFTMGSYINISPRLKQNAPLRTVGPYRIVRHPMYLALMIFCAACLFHQFSLYALFLWLALLLVLACKIHYEEQILRDRFQDYDSYVKTTKRIIPFLF